MKNSLIVCLLLIIPFDDPDPLRFKSDIAELTSLDKINQIGPGGIMFLGSSSIRMWESLEVDFKNYPVYNLGFGGSHTSDVLFYFNDLVIPYKPSLILFYEGDNDLASGKSPGHVFRDFKQFYDLVTRELPGTRIGFIAVKPSPSRWHLRKNYEKYNKKISTYSYKNENVTFIDIYKPMIEKNGRPDPALFLKDSLHMNSKGYDIWEYEVRSFIENEFTPSQKSQ
jgi:lysophospholipase L1-like esterase